LRHEDKLRVNNFLLARPISCNPEEPYKFKTFSVNQNHKQSYLW
jgi:hypothetical protein